MRKKIINGCAILLLFSAFSIQAQTKIGADIDGEFQGDQSGTAISVSSDGSIVAIGAPYNKGIGNGAGHVRVYKNTSGTWTKIGADIDGDQQGAASGNGISLSSDGSIIAICEPNYSGNYDTKYLSGAVRVLKNINGTWTQIGENIVGENANDNSGIYGAVSISSDGSTVAIGSAYTNGSTGQIRIFKNIDGVWTKIGANIEGQFQIEEFGRSVALSGNGDIVAVGAPSFYGNTPNFIGAVRVYKNINNSWVQLGQDIEGALTNRYFGVNISISKDGTIVAIACSKDLEDGNSTQAGIVKVYRYTSDNSGSVWSQIGFDIKEEKANSNFGFRISLSGKGDVLAIGTPGSDANGTTSGVVKVFQNIQDNWVGIGSEIAGESPGDLYGSTVSLSSDGKTIAIGSIVNGNYRGHVRVFDLSSVLLATNSFVLSNTSVYPNPVKENLYIDLNTNLNLIEVNLYSSLGQLVKTEKTNSFSIHSLSKGIYFVQIVTDKGSATHKIIID